MNLEKIKNKYNYYENKYGILFNCDCMELMEIISDKYFELAICDIPYGIGAGGINFINGTSKTNKKYYKINDWDIKIPKKEYFIELFKISKNQIIFGMNYCLEYLKNTQCFIFWDKTIHGNSYADGELLWTSFKKPARIYIKNICQIEVEGKRIHPTQKPISLYRWLLKNYAKPNNKIFDSHAGSASSFIACMELGFNFIGCELDVDYFNESIKRIKHKENELNNNFYIPEEELTLFKNN